jgi:glycolate oxidase iron-sulfur subunit
MLAFKGCVQASVSPATNASAAHVLDRLGITLLKNDTAGCCGAVSYHLGNHEEGKHFFRKNINAWWPLVESGVEALVISASGCGSMIKEYGKILSTDPEYAHKAAMVSELAMDLSEVVGAEDLGGLGVEGDESKVAIHCPCSLQHSQGLPSSVDQIMTQLGFRLVQTKDKHICCGSAGTYSTLQADLSSRLLKQKVSSLTIDNPDVIVTANIGCQMDLDANSEVPVRHWIEVVNDRLNTMEIEPK